MKKNELLLRFTKPGNPGSKFKNPAEKLNKSAILSKNVKEDLGIEEKEEEEASLLKLSDTPTAGSRADLSNEERIIKLFENARYYLLPSFFKTLIYLKKSK